MRRTIAGFVAILVTMPLLSCSMNLNWDSDKPPATAADATQDDSACQSAGYTYGTPEYQQCLQNLVKQRVNAERAEIRPYYVPQR
jgi:hypothetical protein